MQPTAQNVDSGQEGIKMSALNCCGLCREYKDEDSDNGRCLKNKDSQGVGWLMRFNDAPCKGFKSWLEEKEELK